MTYLDHAATTPLRPEARAAMEPWLGDRYGNPSGAHAVARAARRAVDDARDVLAEVLGCQPGEVVFTSGGTEADNLAVFGRTTASPGAVVCSAIEHHAVLHPVEALGGAIVPVTAAGRIDLDALESAIDATTSLVSVMLVNNETGIIQPLDEVSAIARAANPDVVVHTDAVQSVTWLDVAQRAAGADLISISAHKFGGPQGVGALVVRAGVTVAPLLLGGGQERERRSGTHNVAGIVGMAAAAQASAETRGGTVERVSGLRDRLAAGLRARIPGLVETAVIDGERADRIAGTCHVCIPGIESEALLFLLDDAGISASAASSCASGAQDPSHVLAAMGIDRIVAAGSLRLSLGVTTSDADVDVALERIPTAIERLRSHAA